MLVAADKVDPSVDAGVLVEADEVGPWVEKLVELVISEGVVSSWVVELGVVGTSVDTSVVVSSFSSSTILLTISKISKF